MGPTENRHVYELLDANAASRVAEQFRAHEAAAETLAELSLAMEKWPVNSPVVEPTLLPKLLALSQISSDSMGVVGPNPMEYVDVGREGVTIEAFVAPAHSVFVDEKSGCDISTRAILLQVADIYRQNGDANSDSGRQDNLEFFGLNLFVRDNQRRETKSTEPEEEIDEEEIARQKILEGLEKPQKTGLTIVEGRPITGETGIFAVRNRLHDVVKFYSVVLENPEPSAPYIPQQLVREGDNIVKVPLPNDMVAKVMLITTDNPAHQELISEFKSAVNSLRAEQTLDGKVLSSDEILAVRRAMSSGQSYVGIYQQYFGDNHES